MKLPVVFILLIFSVITLKAQWILENPEPYSNNLKFIVFTDSNTAYITGDKGTIIMLKNSIPKQINSITNKNIKQTFYNSPNNIWAVCDSGIILKFDGAKWFIFDIVGNNNLTSIHFCDSLHGWACGDKSTLLKFDGKSWKPSPLIGNTDYRSIWFVDTNLGFLSTGIGLFKYNGSNWINFYSESNSYGHFFFISDTIGFISISDFLYVYNKGTWIKRPYNSGQSGFNKYYQNKSKTETFALSGTKIYKFNINCLCFELIGSNTHMGISAYTYDSFGQLWGVGEGGLIYVDNPTWHPINSVTMDYLMDIQMLDSTYGWATTGNSLLRFHNGKWMNYTGN